MQGLLQQILFQGWEPLLRTAIGTTVTYLALVILLRLAGQRTLAKWYAFDLIVTVALGSTFANSVLTNNITVAQSLVGFVILVGLQFAIAFMVVRWSYLRIIINPQPTLVLHSENSSTMRCAGSASLKPMCAPRSAKEASIALKMSAP
jgi:hypothetical protein